MKKKKDTYLLANRIKYSKTSGITLIALVVTIVVLLILAGITINLVMSDNGVFKTAESAKGKQKEAEYLEQIKIAVANSRINENRTINTSILESSLNNIQGTSVTKSVGDNLPWTVSTNDGYKFQIKEDGSVEAVSGITLSKTSLNLEKDQSETLTVKFTEGVSGAVNWTSSNPAVATVDSNGKVTAITDNGTATITATVTVEGKTHEATCLVKVGVELLEGWEAEKVIAVKSEDNITVPVPIGFTASTVAGEKKVADGFVIYQGTEKVNADNVEEARTSRNQFVWVPYDSFKTTYPMFVEEGGKTVNIGQLYNFTGNTSSPNNDVKDNLTNHKSFREPDTVTTNGNYPGDEEEKNYTDAGITVKAGTGTIKDRFQSQLEDEFEEMRKSVEKYGGFYIGRYETGNWHSAKAVVQKGITDISAISNGVDTDEDATWYAYYQKSKKIAEGTSATSSMIWGCQWDATLNWFLSQNDTNKTKYVFDGTGKGNYSGTNGNKPIATGHDGYDVNNIYDMAGNVYDWTLEANDTYNRTVRRRRLH